MKLEWVIEPGDVAIVRALLAHWEDDPFVQLRQQRNLGQPRPEISRATAWMVIVGCLLTTQQRSGPRAPVKRFLDLTPFPLSYWACHAQSQLREFALAHLSAFGGIRRSTTIAAQIAANFMRLEEALWDTLLMQTVEVDAAGDFRVERRAARFVADSLEGFGPKQSRNFLQWLGVSKYEIPIDSRITKWLNRQILSFRLDADLLSNATYYDMVSDGIIELCRLANVYPCMFDAAVFSSFDKGAWRDADLASDSLQGA